MAGLRFGRTSETPTTTTSQKSIAIHLPFVLQYASKLYCSTLPLGSKEREKCQYSSHLHRSTPPICIAIRLPFVSQYFWENLCGCGHRDAPHRCSHTNLSHPVNALNRQCLEVCLAQMAWLARTVHTAWSIGGMKATNGCCLVSGHQLTL